jgi:hypothetical protein
MTITRILTRRQNETPMGKFLLIITSLFGLAAGAKAETHGEIIVNIPNEFVVAGRTLPAGIYTVSRLSDDRLASLSIASYEQRSGVLVLASQFENRPGNDTKVSFERVGGMYFLRSIETLDGVYTFPLPHSALLMAKSAQTGNMSASGPIDLSAHIPCLVASHS